MLTEPGTLPTVSYHHLLAYIFLSLKYPQLSQTLVAPTAANPVSC